MQESGKNATDERRSGSKANHQGEFDMHRVPLLESGYEQHPSCEGMRNGFFPSYEGVVKEKGVKASKDYLLEALEKTPGNSGEEKAKALKISGNTLSQYKRGERIMDDFACIMVGRMLGIDPMKIIAACQEEREKNQERKEFWRDFRNTLSGLAIAAALGATMATATSPANAASVKNAANDKCLLCQI